MEIVRTNLFREGKLSAIIITGFTPDIFEPLTWYLDRTNDVQTAAIVAALADPFVQTEPSATKSLGKLILAYEGVLNRLKRWEERATFTAQRELMKAAFVGGAGEELKGEAGTPRSSGTGRAEKSAKAACKFCGGERREEAVGLKENLLIECCPECKSALTHCSVCQCPFGHVAPVKQPWFIACDKCRHSGHMEHLKAWFEEHSLCPVPGCECECCSEERI